MSKMELYLKIDPDGTLSWIPLYRKPIYGPVVLFSLRPTPPIGELDLFPLSQDELFRVSLCLGVEIPEVIK